MQETSSTVQFLGTGKEEGQQCLLLGQYGPVAEFCLLLAELLDE